MSIIGESILSVSIEMLIKKLTSEGLRLFARQEQIEADLIKWKKLLLKIKAVMEDADDKQMRERKPSVKMWLDDLQNLAFDVEDILDEFETETLRRKFLLQPQHQSSTSKLQKLLPSCCYNFNPQTIKFDFRMMSKIKDINTRLQEISTQKEQLHLQEVSEGKSKTVRGRPQETSLVNEAKIYGREKDKEAIVELLMRGDLRSDDGFSVIPITGMGGLGKTTLAQLVYNDDRVKSHFDFKAWACVSEDYDAVRVTNSILRSIDSGAGDVNDLNHLQEKLKSKLHGKRFLIVLDDIWNENPNDWELLSRPFQSGSQGCKIIITTRNKAVSSVVATGEVHSLGTLSDDDCGCIFTQYALQRTNFSAHQHLKEIGETIVKKCKGLPLAAKTLGSLLRNKYNLDDWEEVLNCKIWDLDEKKSDIMRVLEVSYYYLPAHLKQCFAYCSLVPKDTQFCKTEIVLLWMAEGLLQPDTSKEIEAIGHNYFQELQSRSFFEPSSTTTSRFVMHDLINDLAQWAAREIYFRLEDILESNKQPKFSESLRYLSYIPGNYDGVKRFKILSNAENLRTFLPVVLSNVEHGYKHGYKHSYLAYNVIHMLLKLQRLRVLSLSGYDISKLPDSIGDLKYLRHLDLSNTLIEALPEATNTLYNLLTLRVENCSRLKELCADMGNLIKLRHLNNTNVAALEKMPVGINKLTYLQTLCYFVVGQDTRSGLRELKSLKHLSETLQISKLENVKDDDDAKEAEINGKKKLKVLFLEWSNSSGNSREAKLEASVLDMLKPHKKLEKLTIKGYGGTSFPIWLGDFSFSNLVLLRFEGCGMCTSLPSLGQLPSLKHLFISKMAGIKRVPREFYGCSCSVPFRSLETLCFEDMQEWTDWTHGSGQEDEAGFLRLRELRIVRCSKLLGILPESLPSLEMLVIKRCKQLPVSLRSLPALCKLEVDGCKEVVWTGKIDLSSLHSASFGDMSDQMFLTGLFKQELPKLKELRIENCEELTYLWQNGIALLHDISSLHELKIFSCDQLLSLVAEEEEDQRQKGLPGTIQSLSLRFCPRLVKLPQALLNLSSLTEMYIFHCEELISFPESALPSLLRTISISHCNSLESLPESWIDRSTSLQNLDISVCNSLTYIARVHLPPSLKQIYVYSCKNLKNLIFKDQLPFIHEEDISVGSSECPSVLKNLCIRDCPSLTSVWSENELPDTLETISIWKCENVKFLPHNLHKLRHLQKVRIWDCSNLVSFPQGGLSSPKLTELEIYVCEKLEALPNCLYNLTSLQNMLLEKCPNIVSFPEHGFPDNLTSLRIVDLKICRPLIDWGIYRFTSLQNLYISGGCPEHVSFPMEITGMMLPSSLSRLRIENFPNLERLSSISGNLTSLEVLRLSDCPKLKSFPENGLPAPDSLLQLCIRRCPLLQEWCEENEEHWSMIVNNIPVVSIG